ncbi:MAG: TetR/AcrR family transcriptional regulator [Cyanobacteriota bacterium]
MATKKEQKEQSRIRILDSADQLFKKNGYVGTGIDSIMAEAGLTAGAFYSHFKSKEVLFSEVIDRSLRSSTKIFFDGLEKYSGKKWLRKVVERYLSKYHRDELLYMCALPTLTIDISRSSENVKLSFENILIYIIDFMEKKVGKNTDVTRERLYSVLSMCISGIILSRSVSDQELSDKLLNSCLNETLNFIGE